MSTVDKGTRWTHAVEQWFTDHGAITVRSRWMERGDDVKAQLRSTRFSVECKNHGRLTMATAVDQAADNAGAEEIPVVVSHRTGYAGVDGAYVVMSGASFARLLAQLR